MRLNYSPKSNSVFEGLQFNTLNVVHYSNRVCLYVFITFTVNQLWYSLVAVKLSV